MVSASGGKEATAKQSKATDSKVPALDYVDIPHSQIRKVKAFCNPCAVSNKLQEDQGF